MGIGVSVAVIGLDKSMYMVGLTPSIKSQIIGTWQADEGYSISFTSDTYTGKDGVSRPYRWQEGTIQTRTLGSLFIRAGNVEIDDDQAQVKRVVRVVMGANGTTLMINVGEQSFQYRKVGVSGAGPSVDHPQTAPSEPVPAKKTDTTKVVPASAPEVSISKPKEETSPATPIDDEDKKADANAMRANLLRSAGLKDNVRKPEEKAAELDGQGKTTATDPLEVARFRGHEIGVKMLANQNAAKQLMSDVINASRQNDKSQAQNLQRQLGMLQRTKSQIENEGVEYAKTLNQAERDAFVEGAQAAQAGK